jgi:hypothetical protein
LHDLVQPLVCEFLEADSLEVAQHVPAGDLVQPSLELAYLDSGLEELGSGHVAGPFAVDP